MDSPPEDDLPEVMEKRQESNHEDSFLKPNNKEDENHVDSSSKAIEEEATLHGNSFFQVKKEHNFCQSGSANTLGNSLDEPQGDSQSEKDEEDKEDDDLQITEDEDDQPYQNDSNQLVVYDTEMNSSAQIEPVPEPTEYQPPPFASYRTHLSSRVLPSVGAYTVQCANCFKWRLIPTKEKYEEIRENILDQPFICDSAREWRPDITCEDPADINQDNSRLWAIDKPSISQPPPGWERLLTIRSEGSTRFADVYYAAPTGKKLRSTVEIQKYLLEHPEYMHAGVHPSQFSFQIPKPLEENYVRKRPRMPSSFRGSGMSMSRPLEPSEVNPLSWAGPVDRTEFQIPERGDFSNPCHEIPAFIDAPPSAKKQRTKSLKQKSGVRVPGFNQDNITVEEPLSRSSPKSSVYDHQ